MSRPPRKPARAYSEAHKPYNSDSTYQREQFMAFVVLLKVLGTGFHAPTEPGCVSNKATRAYLHASELVTVFLRSLNSRENNVGPGNSILERDPCGSHRLHCSWRAT